MGQQFGVPRSSGVKRDVKLPQVFVTYRERDGRVDLDRGRCRKTGVRQVQRAGS